MRIAFGTHSPLRNSTKREPLLGTGFFRGSLNKFDDADGNYLVELLKQQHAHPTSYPLTDKDKRQLARRRKIRALDRVVVVEVPDNDDDDSSLESSVMESTVEPSIRESIQYQAKVAQIGAEMGFRIWVPRNDKTRVLELVPKTMHEKFLDQLPLNYDDTTLSTVEQIDVLWLKGRSMSRAFEIEHTTAIYLRAVTDGRSLSPSTKYGHSSAHCGPTRQAGKGPS